MLVAGKQGLGKTSLLKTLFPDALQPELEGEDRPSQFNLYAPTADIRVYSFETDDDDGNRLHIEAVDTPGFSDDVDPEEM